MGNLKRVSSMTLNTAEGRREIQLFFGDITTLSAEEKVDVVMVSAGPGDYAPSPTSVIGALKHKLNISVKELSRHKEEDLVKNFCCWWSKPLPNNVPFRRLLCFERPSSEVGHPSRLVSEVFRAMFPAFNNQESTVITPLLAAGEQRFSPDVMLSGMVNAAANWIRHGLPLTCLKIVIYEENIRLIKLFSDLKTKWESLKSDFKDPPIVHDVYLSYCPQDEVKATEVMEMLRQEKQDIKIFSDHLPVKEEDTFQEMIYNVMISCAKIVVILSPSYLQSSECLEQFNIALCCDRKTKREMLAPFYTDTIPALPTYMCMVQYIDVRILNNSFEPLSTGCKIFVEMLNSLMDDHCPDQSCKEINVSQMKYDVFISYSHRNTEHATELFAILQRHNPELRIFFDRNELTLGSTWQQSLYYAVDGARCMLALISNEYIKSLVCTEEYNLALAKHMCWEKGGDSQFFLVPIAIETIGEIPFASSQVPILDGREHYTQVIHEVLAAVENWLMRDVVDDHVFSTVEVPLNLSEVCEQHRQQLFENRVNVLNIDGGVNSVETRHCHIGISYTNLTEKYAAYLNRLLACMAPEIQTTFTISSDTDMVSALEKCDLVVALVTSVYTITRKTTDEFHHALGRHRSSKNGPVLYPIHMGTLPFKPLFYQLVPCMVNWEDQMWRESCCVKAVKELMKGAGLDADRQMDMKLLPDPVWDHEILALNFACIDIINIVRSKSMDHGQNTVLNNIVKLKLASEKQCLKEIESISPGNDFFKKVLTAGIRDNLLKCLGSEGIEGFQQVYTDSEYSDF